MISNKYSPNKGWLKPIEVDGKKFGWEKQKSNSNLYNDGALHSINIKTGERQWGFKTGTAEL